MAIATGICLTLLVTRKLRLAERLGTLIGVGTGICGASAIVATGPAIEAKEEEITYAVGTITIFGIGAMFIYPYVCQSPHTFDVACGVRDIYGYLHP